MPFFCTTASASYLFIIVALLIPVGCQNTTSSQKQEAASQEPQLTVTTNILADGVQRLLDEDAQVQALMGPGVDPHLYKASQRDLSMLSEARIVVYNGLHLEGKMADVLERYGQRKPTVAVAELVEESRLLAPENYSGAHDPHIWMDVALWRDALMAAADALKPHLPHQADALQQRQQALADSLTALDEWVRKKMARIPQEQRVLITAHDAFSYFGRAYDIEVRGLQGIATTSEFGLHDVTHTVDFIIDRDIPALFVETSVSPRAIEAVVEGCRKKGHEVIIGGKLYSDALGAAGTPEGTYSGMIRHNVNTIFKALMPQHAIRTP